MKPVLLVTIALKPPFIADLEKTFDVVYAPDAPVAALGARCADIAIVLTNGVSGLSAADMDLLPALRLVSAMGAGYENIDIAYARSRGIVVSNGAGTNDDNVADHALALLLATVRRIPVLDRATRNGIWRDALPLDPSVSGKRAGIIGLGRIGEKIARRIGAFDCEIGYYSRTRRDHSPYRYFADLVSLAEWSDFLVVATPGGASTRHMVNADVLRALGPRGFLVNIARGSVVDTAALASALGAGTVAGAGLDVYESEPDAPVALLGFEQVVLTPHLAGRSPEALQASIDLFIDNARRHLAGEAVSTPL
ncbi:2-hydroxyacid dehydrogenase [Robbsia sp. Bb-Pol-6]|uniref:2-hydroxyacid dehydrogenase n=1 Tax=Robbsia betulipollinis TaxID=2981849 RepID=A0ABT3ZQ90_9BURK|nr:2-hydroxyacid dehydrogenase [Robbsia betulipollinis]MCY0388719.1 2-hydroxyacid dehydrogenase [Robbsia betulipollinis]